MSSSERETTWREARQIPTVYFTNALDSSPEHHAAARRFSLIDEDLMPIFREQASALQREIVDLMDQLIQHVDTDGSLEHLKCLGVPDISRHAPESLKLDLLGKFHWRRVLFLRHSRPSRISEATASLRIVLAEHARTHPEGKEDYTPLLFLGVCLSKKKGRAKEALEMLNRGLAMPVHSQTSMRVPKNILWARAYMSRLHRRMDRIAEAEEQEDIIRKWLVGHPYAMSPSQFQVLVLEEGYAWKDYILTHPSVKHVFEGTYETGVPGTFVKLTPGQTLVISCVT